MSQAWLRHTLERTGIRPRSQVAALITLGVMVTLIFAGAYLSQVATSASTNRAIQDLLEDRDRLERRNEDLRADIAELQTVPRLLERAEQMGFRPATAADIRYLTIDGYNPNRSDTVVPLVANSERQVDAQYDETFSGWLRQQWDGLRNQFDNFGQ